MPSKGLPRVTPSRAQPRVDPRAISPRQRAALAWRLRDILAAADRRCGRYARFPVLREMNRVDSLRGELLALIADLEIGAAGE